ncbi:hypothetical protein LZ31DRAFT_76612 [Colletotrichum somersetense]|nr:hypothetical protein LZ31DRAFT_76612 [Colletotrichum somersetense]
MIQGWLLTWRRVPLCCLSAISRHVQPWLMMSIPTGGTATVRHGQQRQRRPRGVPYRDERSRDNFAHGRRQRGPLSLAAGGRRRRPPGHEKGDLASPVARTAKRRHGSGVTSTRRTEQKATKSGAPSFSNLSKHGSASLALAISIATVRYDGGASSSMRAFTGQARAGGYVRNEACDHGCQRLSLPPRPSVPRAPAQGGKSRTSCLEPVRCLISMSQRHEPVSPS